VIEHVSACHPDDEHIALVRTGHCIMGTGQYPQTTIGGQNTRYFAFLAGMPMGIPFFIVPLYFKALLAA